MSWQRRQAMYAFGPSAPAAGTGHEERCPDVRHAGLPAIESDQTKHFDLESRLPPEAETTL